MAEQASRRCASGYCDAPSQSAQSGHVLNSSKVRESQQVVVRFGDDQEENVQSYFFGLFRENFTV